LYTSALNGLLQGRVLSEQGKLSAQDEGKERSVRVVKGGLLKSSAVVAVMTMLSRVLGLVRDVVVAVFFGASAGADAFFVAFKIPNFFRRLFAEGAFSQAFVPVLTEYQQKKTHEQVKDLVNHVAGTLGGVLLMVTLVGVLATPLLAMVFAPGFVGDVEKHELTSDMLYLDNDIALISTDCADERLHPAPHRFHAEGLP